MLSNIIDGAKSVFPKPNMPQKRYILLLLAVLYVAFKVYVAYTPTPDDDDLPDQLRDVVLKVVSTNAETGETDYVEYWS